MTKITFWLKEDDHKTFNKTTLALGNHRGKKVNASEEVHAKAVKDFNKKHANLIK